MGNVKSIKCVMGHKTEKRKSNGDNSLEHVEYVPVRTLIEWLKADYKLFLAVFTVGMLVHFQGYANGLQNSDTLWTGEEHFADWEVIVGRWGLILFDYLRGGN
nr:hypothetical protein [uncultured Caproiciproducens sp.]